MKIMISNAGIERRCENKMMLRYLKQEEDDRNRYCTTRSRSCLFRKRKEFQMSSSRYSTSESNLCTRRRIEKCEEDEDSFDEKKRSSSRSPRVRTKYSSDQRSNLYHPCFSLSPRGTRKCLLLTSYFSSKSTSSLVCEHSISSTLKDYIRDWMLSCFFVVILCLQISSSLGESLLVLLLLLLSFRCISSFLCHRSERDKFTNPLLLTERASPVYPDAAALIHLNGNATLASLSLETWELESLNCRSNERCNAAVSSPLSLMNPCKVRTFPFDTLRE